MPRNASIFDSLNVFKDAGAVTSSGAATVGGQVRVLGLGPASVGNVKAIIEVSAIDTTDGSETYRVDIQGSNDIMFATDIVSLGSVTVSEVKRYEAAFSNQQGANAYRWARAFHTLSGTTPALNYSAHFVAGA
jgi:hypothetical protein